MRGSKQPSTVGMVKHYLSWQRLTTDGQVEIERQAWAALGWGRRLASFHRTWGSSRSQWNALCKRDTTVAVGANCLAGFLKQIEERFDDVDRHRKHDRGILFGADLGQRLQVA